MQEPAFEQDEIFRTILYRPSTEQVTIHDTIHDDMLISSLLINLEGDKTYHRDDLMKVLGYGRREEILLNGKFEIYSVRNPQARNNLLEMKLGDSVLFYHSQQELSIMGKMIVVEESHQDKTTSDTRWVSVTFEPVLTFQNPIPLHKIKELDSLKNIGLLKQPRLSVIKLTKEEFEIIVNMNNI